MSLTSTDGHFNPPSLLLYTHIKHPHTFPKCDSETISQCIKPHFTTLLFLYISVIILCCFRTSYIIGHYRTSIFCFIFLWTQAYTSLIVNCCNFHSAFGAPSCFSTGLGQVFSEWHSLRPPRCPYNVYYFKLNFSLSLWFFRFPGYSTIGEAGRHQKDIPGYPRLHRNHPASQRREARHRHRLRSSRRLRLLDGRWIESNTEGEIGRYR